MILSNLDDKDLVNYCRTNKKFNEIFINYLISGAG